MWPNFIPSTTQGNDENSISYENLHHNQSKKKAYGPHWQQRTFAGAPQLLHVSSLFILSPSITALKAEWIFSLHFLLCLTWRLVCWLWDEYNILVWSSSRSAEYSGIGSWIQPLWFADPDPEMWGGYGAATAEFIVIAIHKFFRYAMFSSSFLDNIEWNDIPLPMASHHLTKITH